MLHLCGKHDHCMHRLFSKLLVRLHQIDKTEQKLEDIASAVVEELNELCQCNVSSDNIDEAFFRCFEPSSLYVTYRARLSSTPDTDSSTLVSYLESWVSGGPSITVQSIQMRIDHSCSVDIEEFDSGECVQTPASQSSTSTDNTAAIIGSTTVVVLLVIVAVLIFAVVWRSRHGKHKSEECPLVAL